MTLGESSVATFRTTTRCACTQGLVTAPRLTMKPDTRRSPMVNRCLRNRGKIQAAFGLRSLSPSPCPLPRRGRGMSRVDHDLTGLVAQSRDGHGDGRGRQQGQELVRPLDDGDALAVEYLLEPQVHELGEALGAVGVHVVDGQPAAVVVDEHEGGTRHVSLDAEAASQSLEEACLPRAELADAGHDIARPQPRPEARTDGL